MRPRRFNLLKTDNDKVIPLDYRSEFGATILTGVTGTIDYTLQEAFSPVQLVPAADIIWNDITAFTSQVAGVLGASSPGATAIKFVVTSYTGDPVVTLDLSQPNEH